MSDIGDTLDSLKAYYVHRRDYMKKSLAETEEKIDLVEGLFQLQETNRELEEENTLLRTRNDQLEAELRDIRTS